MRDNIENLLDIIEADLERKLEKLKKLRDNQSYIENERRKMFGL